SCCQLEFFPRFRFRLGHNKKLPPITSSKRKRRKPTDRARRRQALTRLQTLVIADMSAWRVNAPAGLTIIGLMCLRRLRPEKAQTDPGKQQVPPLGRRGDLGRDDNPLRLTRLNAKC